MNPSIEDLLSLGDSDIDRALSAQSFHEFITLAWPIVEPVAPFIDNWHIGAMCEHLEAIVSGQIKRLVVNVPPGTMKSLTFGVFLPAWVWGPAGKPGKKFIYGSYSDRVSFRDSLRTKRLVLSDWYQERWGKDYRLLDSAVGKFTNSHAGWRMATTIRGGVTGEHADIQCVDDPLKPLEVSKSLHVTARALEECLLWWNETMSSRLVSIQDSARMIIMQRLHADDLAGEVLKDVGYTQLVLPMRYEKARHCSTSIGFSDPRTVEGELLFPERFPEEAVKNQEKELGTRGAQAQLQQNPIPAEGNIIHLDWFRHWEKKNLPKKWISLIQSWDCTFKGSDSSDFVVGQVWGYAQEGYFLLDQVRRRMGFSETCKELKRMSVKWPKARIKLIENKANGPAVVDALKDIISGMRLIEPEGGKESRLHAVEPLWEEGKVWTPPKDLEWVSDASDGYIVEVTGFPSRLHDDQVDSMSQALVYFQSKSILKLKRAMEKVA